MVVYDKDKKELTIPIGWDKLTIPEDFQPYDEQYFTMEITEAEELGGVYFNCIGSFTGTTIYYSLNGKEWKKMKGDSSIAVRQGYVIRFKANNERYYTDNNNNCLFSAGNTIKGIKVYGNIASLFYGDDFRGHTEPLFLSFFFNGFSGLTDAENLILPSTSLTKDCYRCMFLNCKSLKKAPSLPAETLAERAYWGMFSGCVNLHYIKCLAVNRDFPIATTIWVRGVSPNGVFYGKNVNEWETGNNGIPEGWERIEIQ